MNHTQGPWFVTQSGDGYPQIHPEAEPAYCVGIAPTNIDMPWEEVLANAVLMGASPDLLAACRMAVEELVFGGNWDAARAVLTRAIAKATEVRLFHQTLDIPR